MQHHNNRNDMAIQISSIKLLMVTTAFLVLDKMTAAKLLDVYA
jgi:hypothetical protein